MTRDHARYVRLEAVIGALFGAVFGTVFFFMFFGGAARVLVHGHGLLADAAPQTFMTALFAALFPTFLTRKRLRLGRMTGASGGVVRLPQSVVARVLLIAIVTTVAGVALWAAALWAVPADLPFFPVLAAKTLYGMLIGGGVAAVAARVALNDRQV